MTLNETTKNIFNELKVAGRMFPIVMSLFGQPIAALQYGYEAYHNLNYANYVDENKLMRTDEEGNAYYLFHDRRSYTDPSKEYYDDGSSYAVGSIMLTLGTIGSWYLMSSYSKLLEKTEEENKN